MAAWVDDLLSWGPYGTLLIETWTWHGPRTLLFRGLGPAAFDVLAGCGRHWTELEKHSRPPDTAEAEREPSSTTTVRGRGRGAHR